MTQKPRNPYALICFAVCLALLCSPSARAADWPHWRGPNQDGITLGNETFGTEPFALEQAWARPLGIAYSGISIVDGRVVTMFADGESDFLVAIDGNSGKEIWRYRIADMFPSRGGSEGGPVSVPTIDGDVVFGLGAQGHLFAVRMDDGSEIWSMNIAERFDAKRPHFGFTTSPLVVGDLLFVEAGGTEGRALVGLNKKTGEVLWTKGEDTVGYQSPIHASLAGEEQIVAVTNKFVMGLKPHNGEVLWSHEHGTSEGDGSQSPVLLGDDRFLLSSRDEAAAFKVERSDEGYEIGELWRSQNIKGSFATPVFYEGHLYGFSGEFLTCVSPADGEKIWKSRPPGGQGLIVVDGHLVIYGAGGSLVVAEASPEGYKEKARMQVSERASYTYPSFADGKIFVRNTRDIAGVKVTYEVRQASMEQAAPPANEFDAFLRKVQESENKRLLIDAFMKSQERFPVIEDNRLVHFIYRGDAEDVAITGNMTELRVEEPMQRVEGTDLYYRTYPIEAGARWEYRFNVDFDNPQPDPLNPRRIPGSNGDFSELFTAGWTEADYLMPYEGPERGRVESFELESSVLENKRNVRVYLPAGYDGGDRDYPILVLNDGGAWLDLANLPNSLDHLIGSRMSPIIAVFVDMLPMAARDEFGGTRSADYVRMLADELIPRLEQSYRIASGADTRAVVGAGSGAMMATYAALERPDVFGKSAGCSFYLPDPLGSEMLAAIGEGNSGSKAQFRVLWNRYELHRAEWDLDLAKDSKRIIEALRSNDYDVSGGEVLDGSGWGSWRAHVGDVLVEFFPL